MNRRQKKKAFKKKYGINPKVMTLACEIDWTEACKAILELGNRAMETLEYITKAIIPQWGLTLQELADELIEGSKTLIERIKNMSDEEWEEYKKKLTEEQIKTAERVRAYEQSNIDGQTHKGS